MNKINKSFLILTSIALAFSSLPLLAAPVITHDNKPAATHALAATAEQNSEKPQEQQILLYEQANSHSKILARLSPMIHLIPIFQQEGWLKVGNPLNGIVGWINLSQYHAARRAFFMPNVQTMFVQVEHDADNGKPTVNVIAYKNGKKLDDKEAKALYNKVSQQQQAQFLQMERFSRSFDDMFDLDNIGE